MCENLGASAETLTAGRPRIPMLRQKILESAVSLFSERGFDAVLMDQVAARAGVGKGSVYRQFSSKEQLYTAAVIEGYIDLRNRIAAEVARTNSVPEAVATIISQIVSYFWDRLQFFELLRDPSRLPRDYETTYDGERQKLVQLVSGVLAGGASDGVIRDDLEPEMMVESLLGMIRGIQRHGRRRVALSQAEVIGTVCKVFLNGCIDPALHRADSAKAAI